MKPFFIGIGTGIVKGCGNWMPQYRAVYDAMPVKPADEDAWIQNALVKKLVQKGYFAKAEVLDIFATHTDGSLINWKDPTGIHNPTLINNPAFEEYAGYTGSGGMLNLNFNAHTDGSLINPISFCMITASATEGQSDAGLVGAWDLASDKTHMIVRSSTDNFVSSVSSLSFVSTPNLSAVAHFAMSRGQAGSYIKMINSSLTQAADGVDAFPNLSMGVCGMNFQGSFIACAKQIPYLFIFSYLNEAEINDVMNIMEIYLDHYGNRLGYQSPLDKGLVSIHLTPTTIYSCGS